MDVFLPGYHDMLITKDNRYLVTCSDHKKLKFFDIQNMKNLSSQPVLVLFPITKFGKMILDRTGRFIFTSSKHGRMLVFNVKTLLASFRNDKIVYNKKAGNFDI